MCERPDARVVKSRDSFFAVLAETVNEYGYNLSIRSVDLCKKANKGRATFFRRYRQVGDIFRFKDEEMWAAFVKLDFAGNSKEIVWRRLLLFIIKYRGEFIFKFGYDRDRLFRKMIYLVRHEVAPNLERYDSELSERLFELFYAGVRGIIKVWIDDGVKVEKIDWVVRCLVRMTNSVNSNLAAIIAEGIN